jgi:hypothetical protein
MSYHESNAKKIHYSKLDPSLGFCFLLKRRSHLEDLKEFMRLGKAFHKRDWIFQTSQSKPNFDDWDEKPPKKRKKKAKKAKAVNSSLSESLLEFENIGDEDEPKK